MSGESDQLLARIERLEAELRGMRAAATTPISSQDVADESRNGTTSRRRAVGVLAAGAVGAVAAAAVSQTAAAATDDPVLAGRVNTFTSTTMTTVLARGAGSGGYVNAGINLEDTNGFGASMFGGWGNAYLWPIDRGPNTGEARYPGILWHSGGNVWVSVAAGVWQQLAGPSFSNIGPRGPAGPAGPAGPQGPAGQDGSGTTGGFVPLDSPVRVYDTRPNRPEPGEKAPFAPETTREIDLTVNGSGVPATARAVQVSYVIIYPPLPGFALAWPGGPLPTASQVNYPGGGTEVRGACVALGATDGTIRLYSKGGGDVAVDVYGYFT